MYTSPLTDMSNVTVTVYIEYDLIEIPNGHIVVNVVNSSHHVKQQIYYNDLYEVQRRTIPDIVIEEGDMVSQLNYHFDFC